MNASSTENVRPNYLIIGIILAGAFVSILNSTLLNVALPSMMADFDVKPTTIQWLATGYMLVNGILIPTSAYLIQKFSVRQLFMTAMLLFTIGTITSAISPTFAILLIGRMIQASGAAIMMPLLMNVLLSSFPIEKRGSAMGTMGLVMIFAPAIGPTLSGWIIEHYEWRYLFYMIIPIALLVILLAFFKLKDKKEPVETHLDQLSVLLSSIGFGGLLYGFSSAGDKGWDSPLVYGTIIVGVIGIISLVVRQALIDKPMLDFHVYKYPMFALSSVIAIVINMAMFSAMILMPIYLQTLRGISPFDSGLLMLPGAIIMGIMSPITGKLFDKFGGRFLAVIGLTITVVTTYFFYNLSMDTEYSSLVVLYSIRMLGMSMVMMPVVTNGMNSLPARLNPHGTAINNTLNQVSAAIGSALLVSVMSSRAKHHAEVMTEKAMSRLTEQPDAQTLATMKAEIASQSTLNGINDAFFIAFFIAILALILAFFIKKPKRADQSAPAHSMTDTKPLSPHTEQ